MSCRRTDKTRSYLPYNATPPAATFLRSPADQEFMVSGIHNDDDGEEDDIYQRQTKQKCSKIRSVIYQIASACLGPALWKYVQFLSAHSGQLPFGRGDLFAKGMPISLAKA